MTINNNNNNNNRCIECNKKYSPLREKLCVECYTNKYGEVEVSEEEFITESERARKEIETDIIILKHFEEKQIKK
jgi:NMD protein affecting ribosome stability and mRNA decay